MRIRLQGVPPKISVLRRITGVKRLGPPILIMVKRWLLLGRLSSRVLMITRVVFIVIMLTFLVSVRSLIMRRLSHPVRKWVAVEGGADSRIHLSVNIIRRVAPFLPARVPSRSRGLFLKFVTVVTPRVKLTLIRQLFVLPVTVSLIMVNPPNVLIRWFLGSR